MKQFVKTVLAATMVMGCMVSGAMAEEEPAASTGANDGTVTFFGKIVESPCSIKIGDENQTISLGENLGTASLKAGLTQKVDFDIELVNCVFEAQKNMSIVFNANGDESSTHAGYLATMGTGGEMKGSYIIMADSKGTEILLGTAASQAMNVGTDGKALADQTLRFKAWVQGDTTAATIDTGEFSSMTSFQITYL